MEDRKEGTDAKIDGFPTLSFSERGGGFWRWERRATITEGAYGSPLL